MKVALVHDYLVQGGGAEKVLQAFCDLFPDAPIYTLLYDESVMQGVFADRRVYTSYLQRMPFALKHHRSLPLLMMSAIESFDFSEYDLVLSDSSSFAKGVITRPETLHISYMHTPMRYAWDDCQKYTSDFGLPKVIEKMVPFVMNYVRVWDYASASRVDHLIANSAFVAKRIRKYYQQDSVVIHPPVDVKRFSSVDIPESQGDYYLMVGRLIAYKRHDIAVEAFNKSGKKLKIIGRGPEMERLERMAADNIEFLGRVADEDLAQYYAGCKGFIFPQEEDFGIVAIEALAAGRPLIAFKGGDIVEHVQEGVQGVLFDAQTASSLQEGIDRFEGMTFDYQKISESVARFDTERFKDKMMTHIENVYSAHVKAFNL